MKAFVSERQVAFLLGVPIERLRAIANNTRAHYRTWPSLNKRKDKVRMIRSPDDELKEIQRGICSRILGTSEIGPDVHGGVSKRSPQTNASQHLGAPCLVTLDVRSFYPSVRHEMVFRMFREFGCGTAVANLLTKLTTLDGALPQGAPTSVSIANLLLARPVDKPTGEQARAAGIVYTRFVDDIAMSGEHPQTLISNVAQRLSSRGLRVYRGRKDTKLKIMPRNSRQELTGIVINSGKPTLSRRHRDAVRAAIHELRGIAGRVQREAALRSIQGRIAHVKRFHPGDARRLEQRVAKALS
jgi:RNA-directed DNA polymerase